MQNDSSIQVATTPEDEQLLRGLKTEIDRGVDALKQGDSAQAITIFQSALERTPVRLAAHDVLTHNTLTACKDEIERLLSKEEYEPIQAHLHDAFALRLQGPLANDIGFRTRFADAYYDLGKAFYRSRVWGAALACVRQAIGIQPCPSYYVDLTNALAFVKSTARLEDYAPALKPADLGRHLFVACAPKSGSTFLKNLLVDLTRFRDVFSVYAGLQNEQDLDLPQLARFATENTVTQQHCRATEANIHLMQAFAIRPVVLVRDIFDTVISLRDFYDGGFVYSTFFDREEYVRLSSSDRIELLIDYAVPWYFQFYASWERVERERRLEIRWLSYEELTGDAPATLERVLAFYGIAAQPRDIRRIVEARSADQRGNRFNRGIQGRGRAELDPAQRGRIESLARFFPGTDFSRFGLRQGG
jgi:tetratricopeptide (TPR) repeat protein